MSKVGWSEDHVHPVLTTTRSTRPNHFRRDIGRAGVRADLDDAYRILPAATDNSEKKTDHAMVTDGHVTHIAPLDFEWF